jgi:hypothetical protein
VIKRQQGTHSQFFISGPCFLRPLSQYFAMSSISSVTACPLSHHASFHYLNRPLSLPHFQCNPLVANTIALSLSILPFSLSHLSPSLSHISNNNRSHFSCSLHSQMQSLSQIANNNPLSLAQISIGIPPAHHYLPLPIFKTHGPSPDPKGFVVAKALQLSIYRPIGTGSSPWRGPTVLVLTAGQWPSGTDCWSV